MPTQAYRHGNMNVTAFNSLTFQHLKVTFCDTDSDTNRNTASDTESDTVLLRAPEAESGGCNNSSF